MAKKIRVFVYGTLKSGYGNHSAIEGSKFLGRATITGPYRLVDLGWYPGIAKLDDKAEPASIGGEVYEISHDTLATCDMIEGHPVYFCREKIMTSLGNKAWTYLLPADYAARKPVGTLFWNQTDAEEAWLKDEAA